MGPRGMAAGAVVGSVLGIIAGSASMALIMLSGSTMEEARYWQYKWKTDRADAYREGFDKNMKGTPFYKLDPMQEYHDAKIADSTIDLRELSDEKPKSEEKKVEKVEEAVKKIEAVKK